MKATKATKATTTRSNLLSIFARRNESTCKKVNNANLSKSSKSSKVNLSKSNLSKANLTKAKPLSTDSNLIGYRNYSPKIRQQVISNKLLNSQLYDLYIVRKIHCSGQWLKDNITDGTITIAKQTYIVSWLDILPTDAYKEDTIVLSLRSPKYKDSISKEYSLSYAVVGKIPT